ncbi:MAG: GNAT family N-acetyltransferase [Lactobacillales bacterium]|jgi:predicted GNAT family N-acyltransferase|nr:GNAT family N-acetyltransferase [Lactobacillales bacterium]
MIKHSNSTDTLAYADGLQIRYEVFVEEEHVPENIELDEYESVSENFTFYVSSVPAAVLRLRGLDEEGVVKVERMAVLKKFRRLGFGKTLLTQALKWAKHVAGYKKAVMNAQVSAVPFYTSLGFVAFGDEFDEAGIAHVKMEKVL